MDPATLSLVIESRLENVRLVGLAVHKIAETMGMDPQACYNVELCAVEALSNVVRHAYDGVPDKPIEVHTAVHDDRLEIRIVDQGRPFPDELPPPKPPNLDPLDLDSIPEGGYGIFLMYQLMDVVELSRQGGENVAYMVKRLDSKSTDPKG